MARTARLITAEEREKGVDAVYSTDPTEITDLGDRDAEDAWNDWQEALKTSEASGLIHAHRLPADSDGNPLQGKGARFSHLGSWDHQLYSFEELVEKLRRDFVKPGERAHIKLTGMVKGKRGSMFSQIVTIEKAAAAPDGGESVSQLFRLMQEGQERNAQMLREIIRPSDVTGNQPVQSSKAITEVAKEWLAILAPIVGPIATAIITRPARPKSDLSELVAAMSQMRDFMQGKSDDTPEDSGTLTAIIKSVLPALPDLAKVLASNTRPAAAPARVALPSPVVRESIPTPAAPSNPIPNREISGPTMAVQSQPQGVSNEMLAQIKPHLEELAALAEQKQDPKEVAKLLLSMLPESVVDVLDNLVQAPEAFARLALLSPKVRLHAQWFEELRQALDAELQEDDSTGSTVAD